MVCVHLVRFRRKVKKEGVENGKCGEQRNEYKVADKASTEKSAVTDKVLIKRYLRFCIGTKGKMHLGKTPPTKDISVF